MKSFRSGIHIADRKQATNLKPTIELPAPSQVAISTVQSLGRPSVPIVNKGDFVKRGQCIAKADGPISSQIFASISGEVADIKPMLAPNGNLETHIVIQSDGKDEADFLPPLSSPSAEQIKERICACGIVGLGGAGFPTSVKSAPKTPVDTLLLNGAECEPYLTCDHRLMIEHTDEIVQGAKLLASALGVASIIIGIEKNKPDCIRAFEAYPEIQVAALKKQYPMGSEKHLIYVSTGRKVGIGKLPADSGVVVQNVATAYAVWEAVTKGKPLYERILTVSGEAVSEPKNLLVRVGTSIREILSFCGGEKTEPTKVVLGGPMTGMSVASYDLYTRKTTSGILLLSDKEANLSEPTPCLNCGKCADVCPMRLMPMQTAFYAAANDFDSAAKYGNTMSCIECGACEYICPAKRPLIQAIRKTKSAVRAKKEKK